MQFLINALLLGGVYSCIGMGFSLVYGVMNIINLAHGSLIMIGAYLTFTMYTYMNIDPFLSIPLVMAIVFFIGYLMQLIVLNRIVFKDIFMTMILTYGFELLFINVVIWIWGSNNYAVTPAYSGAGFTLLGAVIPYIRLAILVIALLITALVYYFMHYSKVGLAIQSTALDREGSAIVGINIKSIYAFSYGISAAMAGAAGSMIAIIYNISPSMEGPYLGKAFVIAVLGGLGSIFGAVAGGFALAMAETVGVMVFGPAFADMIAYIVFVLVLVSRPRGLFGKKFFAEV